MLPQNVTPYLNGPDVGKSSEALVLFLNGVPRPPGQECPYPHDVSDLARCIRAINKLNLQGEITKAASMSPIWVQIIAHWQTLNTLFAEDVTADNFEQTGYALHAIVTAAKKDETLQTGDLLAGFTPSGTASTPKAIFVLDLRELSAMTVGRNLEAASLIMQGVEKDYSTPCITCGRRRTVVMDSVYPPTPDKRKCHQCTTSNASI